MSGSGRQGLQRPPTASGGSTRDPRVPYLGSAGAYDRITQATTDWASPRGSASAPPERHRHAHHHHTDSSGWGGAPLAVGVPPAQRASRPVPSRPRRPLPRRAPASSHGSPRRFGPEHGACGPAERHARRPGESRRVDDGGGAVTGPVFSTIAPQPPWRPRSERRIGRGGPSANVTDWSGVLCVPCRPVRSDAACLPGRHGDGGDDDGGADDEDGVGPDPRQALRSQRSMVGRTGSSGWGGPGIGGGFGGGHDQ
jgi:hypothetical protein